MWGFHLLLHFSLFLSVLSLPNLSLLPLSLCLLTAALFVPLSLSLCLYISLSFCQTFASANFKHFPTLTMPLLPLSPKPLTPQFPPASLCCIAHCLVGEQGVMFMGRVEGALGLGGMGAGLGVLG